MTVSARLLRKLLCSSAIFSPKEHTASNKKNIFITFDDGPHSTHSESILDILAHYNIKATFFLLGENIEKNIEVAQRITNEGHTLGNHTYSHKILPNIPRKERFIEINRCQQILDSLQPNCSTKLFRPPQGLINLTDLIFLISQNFVPMFWTIDSKDWVPNSDIIGRLKCLPQKDHILLFHDDSKSCSESLAVLIPLWIKQGFLFGLPASSTQLSRNSNFTQSGVI